jgi:hypothetical protein
MNSIVNGSLREILHHGGMARLEWRLLSVVSSLGCGAAQGFAPLSGPGQGGLSQRPVPAQRLKQVHPHPRLPVEPQRG